VQSLKKEIGGNVLYRNVQVIDGAINSTFDIFQVSIEQFEKLFPNDNNVAFIEDFPFLIDDSDFWNEFYINKVAKTKVKGIHGTLHLIGSEVVKSEFPNRKEVDAKVPY
jgi:TRAP-type C4-dicarboxylate transport system substrate-binding protein